MVLKASKTMANAATKSIERANEAMNDYGFTSTVEKRIHKKGGEFLDYSFSNKYRVFTSCLLALPAIAFLTLIIWRREIPVVNELYKSLYGIQHLGQLIPKAFVVFLIGMAVSITIHSLLGVRHAIKYKIWKLFFDFFLAGWKSGVPLGVIWALVFFFVKM